MTDDAETLHKELQAQFNPQSWQRFTSTATETKQAEDVQSLVLPAEQRGRMPITRADYVIKEDPRRVQWEREVRLFLRGLNHEKGHKVTGAMIYEWATGDSLVELAKREGVEDADPRGGARWGSANAHLRHINWVLKEYFGESRKTTILGRGVGKAYDVRKHFRVALKKPACLTLLPEWDAGTLDK